MNTQIKIAFTGHKFLYFSQVERYLNKIYDKYFNAIWITGGTIGLDTIVALYAKKHNIDLWIVFPFPIDVLTKYWTDKQKMNLYSTMSYAKIVDILDSTNDKSIYYKRNKFMVDNCNILAAFWNGDDGGVANCIKLAEKENKEIIRFSDFSAWKYDK